MDIYIYILDFLFLFPVFGFDPQVVFFVLSDSSQHYRDTTKTKSLKRGNAPSKFCEKQKTNKKTSSNFHS